jgi:hypothetical protein
MIGDGKRLMVEHGERMMVGDEERLMVAVGESVMVGNTVKRGLCLELGRG